MLLDLASSIGTEPLDGIVSKQTRDEITRLARHLNDLVVFARPVDLAVDDVVEELLGRVAVEGSETRQELVQDHAHRPPVDRLAIALSQYDLGREILRCSAYLLVVEFLAVVIAHEARVAVVVVVTTVVVIKAAECNVATLVEARGQIHEADLGETEIGEFDVSERGNEQIVGLEVAMNDAVVVQVLDCECGLGEIGARDVDGKRTHVLDQRGHVATLDVLHHHAQVLACLERAHESHNEWIVRECHDVTFREHL